MTTNALPFIVQIEQRAGELLPNAALGLGIFVIMWLTALIVSGVIRRVGRKVDDDKKDLVNLIARIVRVSVTVTGVICGLGTAGVNILPLVTGLGLTGFALGFAFKDLLSNVLAGMMIILYRPFKRGDRITVSGCSGTVVNIDLRYTTLQSDDKTFLVPNTTLFTNTIATERDHTTE